MRIYAPLFIFYCSCLPSQAAQLQIVPLRLDLSTANPMTYFTVFNQDTQPLLCKIWVQRWAQINGKDVYADDPRLLVIPPIIQIAPQAAKLIRVGALRQLKLQHEGSYRIFVQELVPNTRANSGLNLRLQIRFPLFIAPQARPQHALHWQAQQLGKQIKVTSVNAGNIHEKILSLKVKFDEKLSVIKIAEPTYLLAGSAKSWIISAPSKPIDTIQISAVTDKHRHQDYVKVTVITTVSE